MFRNSLGYGFFIAVIQIQSRKIHAERQIRRLERMNRTRLSRVAVTIIALLIAVSSVFFTGCGEEKSKDKLIVGMECAYEPYNYTRTTDANGAVKIANAEGYVNGYDVLIAKQIAEKLDRELVIMQYHFNGLLSATQAGTIDLIIAGMSPTEERRKSIDFTDVYYYSQLVLVIRKDGKYTGATNLDDFAGAKIVAQADTSHDSVLQAQAADHGIIPQTPMADFPAMIVALKSKAVDAYVAEEPGARADCKSNPEFTYIPLVNNDTGFVLSREETEIAIGLKKGSEYKAFINSYLSSLTDADRDKLLNQAIEYLGDTTMTGNIFEIMWGIVTDYYPYIFTGMGYTLLVSLIGTIIGLLIGVLIGVYRTMPDPSAKTTAGKFLRGLKKVGDWILSAYIEIFRGTPMMVQAMVIFWGFALLNDGNTLNVIFSGLLIVSINTGAYMAEIVRGGIISISKGQFEGAHAIGMTHSQTMFNVVLPQALRNILPSVANEFVINIKDTSVLNVIGFTELYFYANKIRGITYQTFATYLVVAVIYFILTFTITRILRLVEKKMDGKKNYTIQGSQNMDAESFVKEQSIEGGNADA